MLKQSHSRLILLNVLIPIVLGICFYIPGVSHVQLIRNFVPDMLWSYALVMMLFLIYRKYIVLLGAVSALWGGMMELLQLFNLAPGTFDILDILCETIAAFIAVVIVSRFFGGILYEDEESNCNNSLSDSFCRRSDCQWKR